MPAAATVPTSRSGLSEPELRRLARTSEASLRGLEGASLLLTGATGWFGTWLLDALIVADEELGLGLEITAVSRNPRRFLEIFPAFQDRVEWITADVRTLEPAGRPFSHVIHAAAESSPGPGAAAARRTFDTIVEGTRRVIDAAGGACKTMLFVSSGAVYGPAPSHRLRFAETDRGSPDPLDPKCAYAEAKRGAETLCACAAASGVPVKIARCFAFVGPHMPFDRHFAIGNFIADAVDGRPIRIRSDGRPQRSYLYMTDLVRALLAILVAGESGRAYNVGSEEIQTLSELAARVDRVVGGRGVIVEGAASDPTDRYIPDTSRLRAALGFQPEVSLDDSIARTAHWYRAHASSAVQSCSARAQGRMM